MVHPWEIRNEVNAREEARFREAIVDLTGDEEEPDRPPAMKRPRLKIEMVEENQPETDVDTEVAGYE